MTYDVKNVFYLDTQVTLPTSGTAYGLNSSQLDLSAYMDPIVSRGRKGTGLAIYKVHYDVSTKSPGFAPVGETLDGEFRVGLIAGAGLGNLQNDTTITGNANAATADNALAVFGADYYSPASLKANASVTNFNRTFMEPSKEVPYVCVRDNVCLTAVWGAVVTTAATYVAVRLECAIITLDQSTLNQLLRTQTV
tara:strand:- start:683 stop:1264 length:582 start_codon:yes stop_codon:yes gene_type:complete